MSSTALTRLVADLHREVVELTATPDGGLPMSHLDFYRSYVAQSVPVVIRSMAADWPAVRRWRSSDYLVNRVGSSSIVTVALTPNGLADAVTRLPAELVSPSDARGVAPPPDESQSSIEVFMTPMQCRWPFGLFMERLLRQRDHSHLKTATSLERHAPSLDVFQGGIQRRSVAYAQLQNNSLETEFQCLKQDINDNVAKLGVALFGVEPDAANVWIGSSKSATTMHQDWYENLYVVATGTKVFTLIPPWESAFVRKRSYCTGEYCAVDESGRLLADAHVALLSEETGARFGIAMDWSREGRTPWIRCDPSCSPDDPVNERDANDLRMAHIQTVEVHAGDVLYLPATWFHHVGQRDDDEGKVVAVNYWFDMQFGPMASLQGFIERTMGTALPEDDD
jgi:jumonji domain-containing protein 7